MVCYFFFISLTHLQSGTGLFFEKVNHNTHLLSRYTILILAVLRSIPLHHISCSSYEVFHIDLTFFSLSLFKFCVTCKQIRFAIKLAARMIGWDLVKLNLIFKHLKYAWPLQRFNRDLDHGCRFNKVKWWLYIKTFYFIDEADAITCAMLHRLSFLSLLISSLPVKNVEHMLFLCST